MQKYMVLGVVFLLWSCGSPQPASVFSSPSGYDGPTGQIVGTIGIVTAGENENPFYVSRLFFRSLDGMTTGEIAFMQSGLVSQETHYSSTTEIGAVFSLDIPAGSYEFYDVKFNKVEGRIRSSYWAREEFSAPFVVPAGRISYLGSFVSHGVWQSSGGYRFPRGGYFVVADRFDRDQQLISTIHPDISADSIEMGLLKRSAPPFVVR